MDDSERIPRLVGWSLATFHTAFFFAVTFTLLYMSGNLGALLGTLNSFIGIWVYGAFWVTTSLCTVWALKMVGWGALENPLGGSRQTVRVFVLAAVWGAADGMLVLVAILPIVLIVELFGALGAAQFGSAGVGTLIFIPVVLIFVLSFGLPIAAFIGGLVGVVFAVIDGMLLVAARFLYKICIKAMDRSAPGESAQFTTSQAPL